MDILIKNVEFKARVEEWPIFPKAFKKSLFIYLLLNLSVNILGISTVNVGFVSVH